MLRKVMIKDTQKSLEKVAVLLREETTLSLATANLDGAAWITPLFYISDNDLSLYWLSSDRSQHSINLVRQPRAAATVYRDVSSWKEIRGLQMRGSAVKVTAPKLRSRLIDAYCKRFKLGRAMRLAARQSALYRFEPEFFRYIDNARGFGHKFELTLQPEGWDLSGLPA